MSWPTPQEYNEAIQNPSSCFSDDELKAGVVALNKLGLPAPATGACASVYKISSNGTDWAVRCFLSHRSDQEERYLGISEFVWKDDLDCTVPFRYLKEGLRVRDRWYPILKMEWVRGDTLDTYLRKHYRDSEKMNSLLTDFQKLAFELEMAGIAHGDLQHGNVLVTENGLRLVDYDGLYVPALAGMKSLELGHPNYQHPGRTEHHFDTMVDNFSCWLIQISLHALTVDPELFERFGGGEEWILFRRADLCAPEQSPLFTHLLEHPSDSIRGGAVLLQRMIWESPEKIPELSATGEELDLLPTMPSQVVPTPVVEKGIDYGTQQEVRFKKGGYIDGTPRKTDAQKHLIRSKIERGIAHGTNAFFRQNYVGTWMGFKLRRADREFQRARYDLALPIYLEVYKQCGGNDSGVFSIHFGFGKALIGSAYCYGFLGQYNLAHNCFLAIYNDLASFGFNADQKRLTFLLAMSHFINGQPDAGVALMERTKGLEKHLHKLIKFELSYGFLQITEILSFLALWADAKVRSNEILSPANHAEMGCIYSAALSLYEKLGQTASVEIDRLVFNLLVDSTEYLVSTGTTVANILEVMKEFCVVIYMKENRELVDQSGQAVFDKFTVDDYLEIGGVSKQKANLHISILELLTFEKTILASKMNNRQVLNKLEKLSPWAATLFILRSLPGHKTISATELVLAAVPSLHPRSYLLLLMSAAKHSSNQDYEKLVRNMLSVQGIEPGSMEWETVKK